MDSIIWVAPWIAVKDGHSLEAELRREVSPGHPLYLRPVKAIGRRIDQDDVLFHLLDESPRLSVVHLTWRGSVEPDPNWPMATFFKDPEAWAADCLLSKDVD